MKTNRAKNFLTAASGPSSLTTDHRSLITGHWSLVLPALALLAATGCKHLGPKTVAVDRFDYSTPIGDFATKRALTVIMFIFTLTETGTAERLPLVTIPAQ